MFANAMGEYQEKHKLLFNPLAYKNYANLPYLKDSDGTSCYREAHYFLYKDYKKHLRYAFERRKELIKLGEEYTGTTDSWYDLVGNERKNNPLDKTKLFYFMSQYNLFTYISIYNPIYPNIDNPPKGWDKEMMKKLELRLE